MKKNFLTALLFVFIFPLASLAAEGIFVKEAGSGYGHKRPRSRRSGRKLSSNVGKLYCYSLIMNGQGASVIHKWYYKEDLVAAIPLAIKIPEPQDIQRKNIFPGTEGEWRVEVTKEDGTILKTIVQSGIDPRRTLEAFIKSLKDG